MSISAILDFCINHSFLLDSTKLSHFQINFEDKIKSIKPQLERFLDYFTIYTENSVLQFKKSPYKIYTKDFVIKLSQFLNLSCDVTFTLLCNYLGVNGSIENENLELKLTRGYDSVSLMKEIRKYYQEERLSLIKIIRYVFCERKEQWKIISKMILSISNQNKKSFISKALLSYESKVKEISLYKSGDDFSEDNLILFSFEEQVSLLETILLAVYSMKDDDSNTFKDILRIFQGNSISTSMHISRTHTSKTLIKILFERIGLLQGLILVEVVKLDTLITNGEVCHRHFLTEGNSLSVLSAITSKLGSRQCDSVLMLLTSLLCTTLKTTNISNHTTLAKLAEDAIINLDLFKYISATISNHPYSITSTQCSHLDLVIHAVLFDIVSFWCHTVHVSSLDQSVRHDLVKVVCDLVRPLKIYSDVKLLKTGFSNMLEDLSLNFPLNLDMLKVVSSLMDKSKIDEGQSDAVVGILCEFLENLSWFCDNINLEKNYVIVDDMDDDDDGKCARSCKLRVQYRPYNKVIKTELILEEGIEGFLFEDRTVWAVHYSVWDVISAELETTYIILTNEPHISLVDFQRLETILEFLSTCFKSNVQRELTITSLCILLSLIDSGHFLVEGCDGALEKIIRIAGQVLSVCSDHAIVTKIVSIRNLFPQSYSSERLISNDSVVAKAWKNLSVTSNVDIIQAYLDFSLQLIVAEKFMDGDAGVIPSSVFFGSIVFVTSNIISCTTQLNVPVIANLVFSGLTFINEIISLESSLYHHLSDVRKARLELIQRVTLEVISHNFSTIQALLSMSSFNVDYLMSQTNVSSQMLLIEGSDQKISSIVLMCLTVIKAILSLNEPNSAILKIFNSTVNEHNHGSVHRLKKSTPTSIYTHHYVLSLLELLDYPYGAKIARMALIVLKLIVVSTNVSIVACLGERTWKIKELLLSFVTSRDKDQVIRGLIFDFMAECVFAGKHGILQLIFGEESDNAKKNIGYESCLDVIDAFQITDTVSMVLLVSLSKFLSAIWIHDCQIPFIRQKNKTLWTFLLKPLKLCLSKICSYEVLDFSLYEYIGNVYGLFAMEIYSSEVVASNDEVTLALNDILKEDMVMNFLEAFHENCLFKEELNKKMYLDKLLSVSVWWKTLLFTVLSTDTKSGINWLTVAEECKLITKILCGVNNLVAVNDGDVLTSVVVNLCDNLVSCILNILNKRVRLLTIEQAEDILQQINSCLMINTESPFQCHIFHADLMTSCSLILFEHDVNVQILRQSSILTKQFILTLTLKSSINTVDSKVLIHAITANMSTNKNPNPAFPWVEDMAESGTLVNCLSLLHDKVKTGDLSLLAQTLVTFLIRVSSTRLGADRVVQSLLVNIIEIDLSFCDNDQHIVSYLSLTLKLILTLVQQCHQSAHALAFRFMSAHWERLQGLIYDACKWMQSAMSTVGQYSHTSKCLAVAGSMFDLLWILMKVRGLWSMFWPQSMIESIYALLTFCANIAIMVLNEPEMSFVSDGAYMRRGASRSLKHVSFSLISPKKKSPSVTFDDTEAPVSNIPLELASAHLESVVYRLIHSCMKLYSRSTYLTSEDDIYKGFQYSSTLLYCDFDEPRVDKCNDQLSFGYLFSLLTSTQSLLKDNLPVLTIGKEQIFLDKELIRQMHEIVIGTIVSHSMLYLAKFDQSQKTQRNNFILNIKTELNLYLDGLSKSRRRNAPSSTSPISYGPKVTSTPYIMRSSSVGESLDSFCAAIDGYKKSLDL